MYPTYHTVPDGPILIYPSEFSNNSANIGLFGAIHQFYIMLVLEVGHVGKHVRRAPCTTAGLQFSAAGVVQICHLVFKFTILSINVDYLVDYVPVGGMEISWRHGQAFYRNVGRPPRQYRDY